MVKIEGTYKLERNENLEEYGKTIGMGYFARKLMLMSRPVLVVSHEKDEEGDEDDTWIFQTVTFFDTVEHSFKLNEPYPEDMPNGDVIESTTTREGDHTFITKSSHEVIGDFERIYDFDDDSLVVTMKHNGTGTTAKRFYKRQD